LKRNDWMSKKPNQNRAPIKNTCHRRPSTAVQPHSLHTRYPLPGLLIEIFLFLQGEVLSRSTLHPHPRAHLLLNLQLFLHHHPPPMRWLKNSDSLTQTRPYPASRTPPNPHVDAQLTLAFPRSDFPRQTASSLCELSFHGIGTSTSLSLGWLLVGNDADGNGESPSCSR
jgi:hypothetical protein